MALATSSADNSAKQGRTAAFIINRINVREILKMPGVLQQIDQYISSVPGYTPC